MRFRKKTGLVFLFVWLGAFWTAGQTGNWQFGNYTIEDGLPNNNILAINQDSLEYIWIGTENGLSRYNGINFTSYTNITGDSTSLPGNSVNKLFVDSRKRLLIGTSGGLCLYNIGHDNFTIVHTDDRIAVRDIAEDSKGNIWVATEGHGLLKFSPHLLLLEQYHGSNPERNLPGNYIWSLFADGDMLWIGTLDGRLLRLNPETRNFTQIREYDKETGYIGYIGKDNSGNLIVFGNNTWLSKLIRNQETGVYDVRHFNNLGHYIYNVRKRKDGTFWITHPGGILVYHPDNDVFRNLNEEAGYEDLDLGFGSAYVFTDRQGNIWMGGQNMGLYHISHSYKQFFHYMDAVFETSFVNTIIETRSNDFIAGTNIGGILKKEQERNSFSEHRNFDVFSDTKIISNTIYRMLEVASGKYLIATYRGLILYDASTGKAEHFYKGDGRKNSLKNSRVYDILQTDSNMVWLATNGGGVYILDLRTLQFTNIYQTDEQEPVTGLVNNYCISLMKDRSGKIWIGTYNGLSIYDPATEQFRNFLPDPENTGSLSHNWIFSIYEDSEDNVWVGTYNGLNLYEPHTHTFRQFGKVNGLADNIINSIIEDNHKHIWIGTAKGVSKISLKNLSINTYGKEDGLRILQFGRGSAYKDRKGYIYLGGKGGILVFNPERITRNPFVPSVRITGLKLFNKPVSSKTNPEILPKEIISLEKVRIPFSQKVITFEFTAFNYINPSMNSYAYRLVGFDRDWQYIDNKREVTYTNLDPGEYVFKAKAANNDRVWNEEGTQIRLIITPPWWMTLTFRIVILLAIAGLVAGFYFFKVTRLRKNKEELERLVNERTREVKEKNQLLMEKQKMVLTQAERLRETNEKLTLLNASKDRFFSVIAHDLKNPFNSLLGFSEMLSNDFKTLNDERKKQIADVIRLSSERIYGLLENLLQWAGTQTGNMPNNPEVFDLREVIDMNHDLIREQLAEKKNKLVKSLGDDNIVFADRNMISAVVRNLLGNAVKFTENGIITVEALANSHFQRVTVRDSGVGIPQEKLEQLFSIDRINSSGGTRGEKGTGLGLLICKEFVQRNGGELKVESEEGVGTSFTFTIPKS